MAGIILKYPCYLVTDLCRPDIGHPTIPIISVHGTAPKGDTLRAPAVHGVSSLEAGQAPLSRSQFGVRWRTRAFFLEEPKEPQHLEQARNCR